MKREIYKSQYFISTIIVCGVAGLCFPFTEWIGYRSVALLLLLTVSVIAMRFSLYPVLLAASLSALIWYFFFIPPVFTFIVSSKEDALLLIMYFVVASLSGVFNYKLRQFEHIERQKEERETTIKLYNTLFDSLSHELRTPIATILGATDTLQENEGKLSKQDKQELTSEITNAALRLNSHLENLLNTSRIEAGFIRPNFEWCDVNELVYNILSKLEKDLVNHKTVVEIDENISLVKLDYGLMEQVLSNIIKNAAIYTPDQSLISIKAYLTKQHEGFIRDNEEGKETISTDTMTQTLIIEISDNGKGIPNDELEAVFTKFYRLEKTKPNGTGLGLFITKGFVEAQGGTIKVVNKFDGGALFVINLPTIILPQMIHNG